MVLDTYIPGTYTCTRRGCKYYLNNDVTSVMIAHRGNKKYKIECTLKTGFQTDGASVPWLFSWFVPNGHLTRHITWLPCYMMQCMVRRDLDF